MIFGYLAVGLIVLLASAIAIVQYGVGGERDVGPNGYALPTTDDSSDLDRILSPEIQMHKGQTGVRVISDDLEAFRIRLDLAREAGRSLDLQYYYWKSDITGKLLAREILAAADRGVRVRLMLDDINSMGLDSTYLALNTHPQIEVRLFNPSRSRTSPTRRGIELVVRYYSATRRMHNKCWIVDGRVAIVGGRNVGDAYFGASSAYAKYRHVLVESGISLFEQKPSPGRTKISLFGSRTASLHTKACVADRRISFVGSFNLDPRSKSINTEMGIILESEAISKCLAELLETQMQKSYRLESRNGRVVWLEQNGAKAKLYNTEPHSRPARRISAWLVGFLPIESQL